METDWAENRAKLPQDVIRRTAGPRCSTASTTPASATASAPASSARPTAAARSSSATAACNEAVRRRRSSDDTLWRCRARRDPPARGRVPEPADGPPGQRRDRGARRPPWPQHAGGRLRRRAHACWPARRRRSLEVDEAFDRAWRRVGLALDRSGFTVEDRNRSDGLYFVRYVDSQAPATTRGFFGRLFGSDEAAAGAALPHRLVSGTAGTGRTVVAVQTADGAPLATPVGQRIAAVLLAELR